MNITGEIRLGFCVYVLSNKLWGKITVQGKLRSQRWWELGKKVLMSGPDIKSRESIMSMAVR